MGDGRDPVAIIGIGSNSVRLLLAQRGPDGGLLAVERRETVTRLAGYVAGPAGEPLLAKESMQKTVSAAREFAERASTSGARLAAVLATEAVRTAHNRTDLTDALERETGLTVNVISGEDEAALGWRAVASKYGEAGLTLGVVDIGGGSTDLSVGQAGEPRPTSVLSLRLGSRTLMSRFGLADAVEPEQMIQAMAALLEELAPRAVEMQPRPKTAVVIGGTAPVLAMLFTDRWGKSTAGQDVLIGKDWLFSAVERLAIAGQRERVSLGVPPDRADVVVAGGAILMSLLDAWGLKEFHASQRNILDGYLADIVG